MSTGNHALDAAEKHRQQQDHERQQYCARYHQGSWWVSMRKHNRSAFNGYHWTPSAYSECRCAACGRRWRTDAAYVGDLPDEPNLMTAQLWFLQTHPGSPGVNGPYTEAEAAGAWPGMLAHHPQARVLRTRLDFSGRDVVHPPWAVAGDNTE